MYETPLHHALGDNRHDIVKLLLRYNARADIKDTRHITPLDQALKRLSFSEDDSDLRQICFLLTAVYTKQVPTNDFVLDMSRSTVLHTACATVFIKVVEQLLKAGAPLDARDEDGQLLIHHASKHGQEGAVSTLLKAGASSHEVDAEGETPLHIAAANDGPEALQILISWGALVGAKDAKGRRPIHRAAKSGNLDIIKALVDADSTVCVPDEDGRTPLHITSAYNRSEAVRSLVAQGADITAAADDGSRPLHEAMLYGAIDAVERLLEYGAKMADVESGDGPSRILQPPLYEILRLPSIGHHVDLGSLSLSSPANGTEAKKLFEEIRGSIWPWNPAPSVLATPTVHDLLYTESSYVKKDDRPTNAS